ncbi:MAG: metal-dependent hydrolase [Candidatus Dormibacteria bacterium]
MMKMGHYSSASPVAVGLAWVMALVGAPIVVALVCAGLVVWTSTSNDLDHPRFKDRMHPGAALVRGTGHLGYLIRTGADKHREDVHRGPSHCVEWCLLAGVAVGLLTALVPPLALWAVWWGLAVALGTFSHVVADWTTPSGVPMCATWNYFRYGEVWRRHSLHWFATDSAGEKYLMVPALFVVSGLMVLGMVGLLGRVVSLLTGWTW